MPYEMRYPAMSGSGLRSQAMVTVAAAAICGRTKIAESAAAKKVRRDIVVRWRIRQRRRHVVPGGTAHAKSLNYLGEPMLARAPFRADRSTNLVRRFP